MTKTFLSDNIQNLAGTRTLPPRKLSWRSTLPALFTKTRVIVTTISAIPAVLWYLLFGAGGILAFLSILPLYLVYFAVSSVRNSAKREIVRYHAGRENVLLDEEEIQALSLSARFIYRDQGWYHTYESYPFWDRKAGYDDPAFSKSRPYRHLKFDYSEHLMRGLKRDWDISSKQGALSMIHSLRDGKLHRCAIVSMINQEGFSIVYDILSDLSGAPHDSFHPVFFSDEEDEHQDGVIGQSLVAALDQFGVDEAVFLERIKDKCAELDDPENLALRGDARDQIFQMVRHIGRLAVRNDVRNMFLFKEDTIDKVLYPQGELDLLTLGWAFDLSRGMFLLRRAYAAGLLTREELRNELPAYRQVASAVFSDWSSYFCSEAIGYLSWKIRDAKPDDAYAEAAGAANECHEALRQEFPIGRQVSWPEADAAACEALKRRFAEGEVNPIFMPQTLGGKPATPVHETHHKPEERVLH